MNIVITGAIMQQIVEAMDHTLSIDNLDRDEEQACKTLHDFFYEILYGASAVEAIKQVCGESAESEFLKIIHSEG